MKFKLNPIQQCVFFLMAMALTASALNPQVEMLIHLAATVGFSLVLWAVLNKISKRKKILGDTLITGLILFLILHYPLEITAFKSIGYSLMAVVIAMGTKYFLTFQGMPVFNPATAGLGALVALSYAIPSWEIPFISWWGADFKGWISLTLVLAWMIWGLKKWRKYPLLMSFLIMHLVVLLLRDQTSEFIQYSFTHSTLYFMASIMLIEPKTSPILRKQQVLYGVTAALTYNLFLHFGIPFGELWTILTANALNTGMKAWKLKTTKIQKITV